jgi:multiple sugar transport system substrate-binding protein
VFKSSKHPKEATQFDIWLQTNQQSLDAMIKAGNIFPSYAPALNSPSVNGPNAFFGGQAIGPLFKQASTQVNVNFQWGPTIDQVYNDMGDQFSNVVNGHGSLSDGLAAVQQSTITYMQKQGFNVST